MPEGNPDEGKDETLCAVELSKQAMRARRTHAQHSHAGPVPPPGTSFTRTTNVRRPRAVLPDGCRGWARRAATRRGRGASRTKLRSRTDRPRGHRDAYPHTAASRWRG